jgi:hypothetical protein
VNVETIQKKIVQIVVRRSKTRILKGAAIIAVDDVVTSREIRTSLETAVNLTKVENHAAVGLSIRISLAIQASHRKMIRSPRHNH